ncbi:MAG: NADH:flavin oxidoreductase [Desulfobacteraceae bacterium]|jgi:2,4-dienoyl-CoA reductase-like NADH-dependent reductase (Old Yellow Enzyme family)|nr:NADH:flavin oxidoreductase [Desulfobacteraceae bacterium]
MNKLFETTEINEMKLANRFVRSATWEGMAADDGSVTPKLTQTMVDLAEGGVGMIISGHAFVSPEGQAGPWQLGIYKDELVDGLKTMTDAVHKAGGKIVAQLAHAGHFAPGALTKQPPHVVSTFEGLAKSPRHELTKEDIQKLVSAFADAASRAKSAGFDGVQIHSAHGYLFSQFLSSAYNRRDDEYGGAIENRARIHLETYNAIRNAVGNDYPVLIKINCEDYIENGLTLEDSVAAAKMLADAGIDAIELSGGTLSSGKLSPSRVGINKEEKEAYFKEGAAAYKKVINIPLILVGGNRSMNMAEQTITSGTADYISMCRPFIREPGLINRWQSGDTSPARCKSDNLCFGPAMEGKGIYCVTDELEKAKQS